MTKIAVIDYGMGNLHSVGKALERVCSKEQILVTSDPKVIQTADKVVNKIYFLFKKKVKGVFNIGTGNGISVENFAKKLTKKKIKIKTFKHKKIYSIASMKKFNSLIKK